MKAISVTNPKKNHGRKKWKAELRENKELYIMAIPVVLFYVLFCYLPMFGLVMAFQNYEISKGILGSEWVGFKYFTEFFGGLYFKRTLLNTLLISLYKLAVSFPASIILALLLNEVKNTRFKSCVQVISYLPHFISLVVMCGMISNFLSTNGIVTRIFSLFGADPKNYLGIAKYFKTIYVLSDVWQEVGWGSIIYLAALSGVDTQLYEAAAIDGAGRFRQVINITLPSIRQTVVVMLILSIGQMLSVGYEKIILLYSAPTYETADVISSYVYRMGIENARYSFSSAVGIFQSVVNLVLLISANWFSKKYMEIGLF